MLERMELGCNARNGRTMTTMRMTHATTVDKLTLLAYGNPMWKDTLADTCGKRYRRRGKRDWPKGLNRDLATNLSIIKMRYGCCLSTLNVYLSLHLTRRYELECFHSQSGRGKEYIHKNFWASSHETPQSGSHSHISQIKRFLFHTLRLKSTQRHFQQSCAVNPVRGAGLSI